MKFNQLNPFRPVNRDARLLLLTAALTTFSYIGIYTLLFNLYLLRLGYGPQFIGLINGAAQLTFALFSLPAGALGSRWGSRRVAMAGLAVTVVTFVLLPMVELTPRNWQSSWLLGFYMLAWLAGALYLVNSYPLLMQVTGPAERDRVFALRQTMIPLGNFLGSLVAGVLPGVVALLLATSLDQPAPFRYSLLAAAVGLLPGVLALRAIQTEAGARPEKIQTARGSAAPVSLIAFMALIAFLHFGASCAATTFFPIYLDTRLGVPTHWIGLLAAAGQLLAIPVALATPAAVARWGKRQTVLVGLFGSAVSLLPLALLPHWGAAGLGFLGVVALESFTTPALVVCQQEIVSAEWRPLMSGAIVMAVGSSSATVALGGGYLATQAGYTSLFLAGSLMAALAAGLIWSFARVPRWLIIRRAVTQPH